MTSQKSATSDETESVDQSMDFQQQQHQQDKSQDHILLNEIVCLPDFELIARAKLDEQIFSYFNCGSDEEITRKLNHQMIIDKYFLRPRCFRNVSQIDTTKYIFGDKLCMPIGIAPTSLHGLLNERAELATVRAASNQNALMILSQFSSTSLEDVAREAPICTKWQNIYLIKNRDHSMNVINRAIRYGYRAVVITCDCPISSHRRSRSKLTHQNSNNNNNNNNDANFALMDQPTKLTCSKFPVLIDPNVNSKFNKPILDEHIEWDDSRNWQDLADLKKSLGDTIRIIVKGILTAEDADCAIRAGVDGIYVSNSGGIHLDCCQSTIEALPEIVRVVGRRVPVFVDGGFETGNDVMKALALGADMVFLGRPIVYSLAAAGEQGVEHGLKLIHDELKRAMAYCGCKNLDEITNDIIMERKR